MDWWLWVAGGLALGPTQIGCSAVALLFGAEDHVTTMLEVAVAMLSDIAFDRARMRAAVEEPSGYLLATEAADWLVRQGVAFREAHEIVGRIVRYCVESGERLEALSLARLREFCPVFKPDVSKYITAEACVERRLSPGGTSSRRVSEAIQQAKREAMAARKREAAANHKPQTPVTSTALPERSGMASFIVIGNS